MPRPFFFDELYSYLILGDVFSPGLVTLSGHDVYENWDVQNAKGSKGSSSKLDGRPIIQFTANFYLADDRTDGSPDEFDRWDNEFRPLIESMTAGVTPVSLPIYHPDLAAQHITEVSSGGIGAPIHDGRGGMTWPVKFIEHKPPKPKQVVNAKGKNKGGVRTGTTTVSAPDPNAERKARLASLVEQARQP